QILAWADKYYRRTRMWPTARSGPIPGTAGETWRRVDNALRTGKRGLRSRSGRKRLVERQRGVPRPKPLAPLLIAKILEWADKHRRRTGEWPNRSSGRVPGASSLTWAGLNQALRKGRRGLPGHMTLAALLAKERGVRNRRGDMASGG